MGLSFNSIRAAIVAGIVVLGVGRVGAGEQVYSGLSPFGFKYYSFADLVRDVTQAKAQTVADAIAVLPGEFLDNLTLVRAGFALQASEPAAPRAVLFGGTANLVVTFNGAAHQTGYDSLETAEFDESKQRIYYRAIIFKKESSLSGSLDFLKPEELLPEQNGVIVTKENPRICMGCHMNDPRDINSTTTGTAAVARYRWSPANQWPSLYGKDDDTETPDFVAAKTEWMTNPRYRLLFKRKNHDVDFFPYWTFFIVHPEDQFRLSRLPNRRVTELLAFHYARQMVSMLADNRDFATMMTDELNKSCATGTRSGYFAHKAQRFGFLYDFPTIDADPIRVEKDHNATFETGSGTLGDLIGQVIATEKGPGLFETLKKARGVVSERQAYRDDLDERFKLLDALISNPIGAQVIDDYCQGRASKKPN